MSKLLARIMLVIFMIPTAGLLYAVLYAICDRSQLLSEWFELVTHGRFSETVILALAGAGSWIFLAVYWWLIWRSSVRFTGRRRLLTLAAAGIAIAIGFVTAYTLYEWFNVWNEFSAWAGSVTAPLVWLITTTIIWRDTNEERASRIVGTNAITCPSCGYNLTGLRGTRCPECGKEFTLDALLAGNSTDAGPD